MKKRSGNHIDDIFREKLQEGEKHIDYRESDWDALEKKLGKTGRTVLWLRILGGAAAVLAGLAFWLFFDRDPGEDDRQVTQTEERAPEDSRKSPGEAAPDDAAEKPGVAGEQDAASGGTADSATDETDTAVQAEDLANAGKQEVSPLPGVAEPGAESGIPGAGLPGKDPTLQELLTGLQGVMAGGPVRGEPTPVIHPRLSSKQTPLASQPTEAQTSGEKTGPAPGDRFTLSVLAAPAFNGVGSFSDASVGGDVGLLVTARLSRKWSVSTGAVYSRKTYGVGPEQYNPVRPYNPPAPVEWIDADCRVLDIPLNIHYTLLEKNRNRITLGTGLSSYLMLGEDYTFLYDKYGQDPYELNINNENRHWFGVLNLQASYQRQLSSGLSIGLQPFIKLPVNDIGYGRVKLQSAGIAVHFNWNLSGKRR